MSIEKLIKVAKAMRNNSRAPYSKYKVGSSVETNSGDIIGGCNIESSSYGLTCCAERIALYNAISLGHNKFTRLAVASENGAYPCGACRQIIWELCENIPVYIVDNNSNIINTTSKKLLPNPFDKKLLKEN
tara:strand:- start:76 stop:468 length:393 start_codon:yes stop_codon:yes gene_type:complete